MPHFKFAPLDYGCTGVFTFKIVKQLEAQHGSLHQAFALKLVCQKCLNVTLTFDLCDLFSTFYHEN